jgi:hypothetical protein
MLLTSTAASTKLSVSTYSAPQRLGHLQPMAEGHGSGRGQQRICCRAPTSTSMYRRGQTRLLHRLTATPSWCCFLLPTCRRPAQVGRRMRLTLPTECCRHRHACAYLFWFKTQACRNVAHVKDLSAVNMVTLFEMKPCQVRGFDAAADDYSALVDAGRRAILQTFAAAGIGDMQPHIQHEEVTPPPEV